MPKITLITGGARSGKSTYGEELAHALGENILYVATAKAIDDEMRDRIRRHQERRPDCWRTLEQYSGLGATLPTAAAGMDGILLDCVTIMSTNILFDLPVMQQESQTIEEMNAAEDQLMAELDSLIAAFPDLPCDLIMVTNEVGLGLVPEYPLSRFYRDALGRVNQRLGRAADEVWFVISGIPMRVK